MDKIEKVSVNGQVYELAGSGGASAPTSITYSELKALVESSGLQAGARYRITDYVTSFKTWESAGHPFDIVVTALDAGTLLAEAVAMPHEEDEYFANNDLTAWKLFYDINNDTAKYVQAKEDGKGFIYSMTDEYGNKANYDFKNALRRVTTEECDVVTESGGLAFYTFSKMDASRNVTDYSLSKECHNNEVSLERLFYVPSLCYKTIIGAFHMRGNKIHNDCFICYQLGICENNQIDAKTYTSTLINSFKGNIVKSNLKVSGLIVVYDSIIIGDNIDEMEITKDLSNKVVSGSQVTYINTIILPSGLASLTSSSSSDDIKEAVGDINDFKCIIDEVKNGSHIVLPFEQDGATMMVYPFFTGYKETTEEYVFQFASYAVTFTITYNNSTQTYSYQ